MKKNNPLEKVEEYPLLALGAFFNMRKIMTIKHENDFTTTGES